MPSFQESAASPASAFARSADRRVPTACFAVHARAEPGVMPRVLEQFAKRGLIPSTWHSAVWERPGEPPEMQIDLQMRGLERDLAEQIAAALRQVWAVEAVLTSEKPS